MKTYIERSTGKTVNESDIVGTWPDRSPKTVQEAYDQNPEKEYLRHFEGMTGQRKSEVFELACRIMVGHAQAGIKPNPSDAMEVAKEAFNLKDKL